MAIYTIRTAEQAVSSSIKDILDADRVAKEFIDIVKAEGEITEPISQMLRVCAHANGFVKILGKRMRF